MLPVCRPVRAFETDELVASPPAIVALLVGLISVGLLISELREYWKTTVVLVPLRSPLPTTEPLSVAPVEVKLEAADEVTNGAAGVVKLNVLEVVVPVALVANART